MCCFVALIKENLEIIWESFLNENCTLESLVYGCKIVIGVWDKPRMNLCQNISARQFAC